MDEVLLVEQQESPQERLITPQSQQTGHKQLFSETANVKEQEKSKPSKCGGQLRRGGKHFAPDALKRAAIKTGQPIAAQILTGLLNKLLYDKQNQNGVRDEVVQSLIEIDVPFISEDMQDIVTKSSLSRHGKSVKSRYVVGIWIYLVTSLIIKHAYYSIPCSILIKALHTQYQVFLSLVLILL